MHTDAWDALVNLKKYIRESDGPFGRRLLGREDVTRLIDEFMQKAVAPPFPVDRGECICALNQEAVSCPRHGNQSANREPCPLCGTVLGYCAQGEYCTNEDCRYVA